MFSGYCTANIVSVVVVVFVFAFFLAVFLISVLAVIPDAPADVVVAGLAVVFVVVVVVLAAAVVVVVVMLLPCDNCYKVSIKVVAFSMFSISSLDGRFD